MIIGSIGNGHKFTCWKDGYDLTDRVRDRLEASVKMVPPVVLPLIETLSDVDIEEIIRSAPQAPITLEHPSGLDDQAPERAAHIARVAVAEKVRHGQGSTAIPRNWTFIVTCPKDKADNTFSSDAVSGQPAGATIVGTPTSVGDTAWVEAAKTLAPAQSLVHASDSAKYVVQNISLVALVLGGFGLFTNLAGGLSRYPILFGAVAVAAALALGLAVWALFPLIDRNVDYNNLDDVRVAYVNAITHRANFARLATGALLVAIGLAVVSFFVASGQHDPNATIATVWDGSGQQSALDTTVDMKDLPPASSPTVRLIGVKAGRDTVLSSLTEASSRTGTAKLEEKLTPPAGYEAFRIEATVSTGGKTQMIESATLLPPTK